MLCYGSVNGFIWHSHKWSICHRGVEDLGVGLFLLEPDQQEGKDEHRVHGHRLFFGQQHRYGNEGHASEVIYFVLFSHTVACQRHGRDTLALFRSHYIAPTK